MGKWIFVRYSIDQDPDPDPYSTSKPGYGSVNNEYGSATLTTGKQKPVWKFAKSQSRSQKSKKDLLRQRWIRVEYLVRKTSNCIKSGVKTDTLSLTRIIQFSIQKNTDNTMKSPDPDTNQFA